jgi:hypothetical protein
MTNYFYAFVLALLAASCSYTPSTQPSMSAPGYLECQKLAGVENVICPGGN